MGRAVSDDRSPSLLFYLFDKRPAKSNLCKEGFVLAHNLKAYIPCLTDLMI